MKITSQPISQVIANNMNGAAKMQEQDKPLGQSLHSGRVSDFSHLGKLNEMIGQQGEVNLAKVKEVQTMLARGQLSMDLDALSDAIITMHRGQG